MKQIVFYLYAGFLSFMCAEVFAGSSPNWILSPWSLLVTYPLYMSHFLFFCNLACLTKRTSLGSLYLWGVLFGLYETWVTKVVWTGYFDVDGFVIGDIFGFGVHETLGLIMFYHTVASFLIPLMVLSAIFPSIKKEFSLPSGIFNNEGKSRIYRYVLIVGFGVITAHNLPGIEDVIITWLPSLFVCYAGYRFLSSRREQQKETFTLSLSIRSTFILGAFVLFTYVTSYFFLVPERIPEGFSIQLLTLIIYGVIIFLLVNKRNKELPAQDYETSLKVIMFSLIAIFGICSFLGVIKLFVPVVIKYMAFPVFLSLIPAGAFLFFKLGVNRNA